MNTRMKRIIDAYENDNPDQREWNEISIADIGKSDKSGRNIKPFAMNVGYSLDQNHNNRDKYLENFDKLILPNEKEELRDEMSNLFELSLMLQDPEFILDDEDDFPMSENRDVARQALMHILGKNQEDPYEELLEEVYRPMLNNMLDRTTDKRNIIHDILSPNMVKRTHHPNENYSRNFNAQVTAPAFEGIIKNKWKDAIPALMGGQRG